MKNDGAVELELLARLMQYNADCYAHTADALLENAWAERDCLRDGIRWALSYWDLIAGGTTREYERVLSRFESVLYPPPEARDYYHERYRQGRNEGNWVDTPWLGYRPVGGGLA